jgi:hypothetical protein
MISNKPISEFENDMKSMFKFKWRDLGNGYADFHEISYFDRLYNKKKTRIKKVITIHYETLYPL